MHVKAKKAAFGGVLLALTILFMVLGSMIETSTLFLLAAASYFVGIVFREFGGKTGAAFYLAGVLLGAFLAPNKFYVASYAAMGLYILVIEMAWELLGSWKGISGEKGSGGIFPNQSLDGEEKCGAGMSDFAQERETVFRRRKAIYEGIKFATFNLLYLPAVFLFQELLFGRILSAGFLAGVIAAGQVGVFLYDRAYIYVQREIWGKMRGKFLT